MHDLQALEIASGDTPTASVIWLHGLGADGYDFAPVVEMLQPMPAVRFILPHAPQRPVTINGGYRMPAWYDIYGRDIAAEEDEAGIRASQALVETLIARERQRGIPSRRIALAGFSQGGAIALHTGLRHGEKLAGIIVLSSYLPLPDWLESERHASNRQTPIFMAHGTFDEVIPLETGRRSADCLAARGYRVDWREYRMPHAVCNEEIMDIRDFIAGILLED